MASNVTVGAVASSLAMWVHWTLPLAQAWAFTSPECFSVRNINKLSALRLSSCKRVDGSQGLKHFNSLTGNYVLTETKIVLLDRYMCDLYIGIVQQILHNNAQICEYLTSTKNARFWPSTQVIDAASFRNSRACKKASWGSCTFGELSSSANGKKFGKKLQYYKAFVESGQWWLPIPVKLLKCEIVWALWKLPWSLCEFASFEGAVWFLVLSKLWAERNINSTSLNTQVENLLVLHVFSQSLGNKEELIWVTNHIAYCDIWRSYHYPEV